MISSSEFLELLWGHYAKHGRALPWRQPEPNGEFDPYNILVSEIMLQQTQVTRVMTKYAEFLDRFPNLESLAQASQKDVLAVWSGLGYNRRAKFLHQAVQKIYNDLHGQFPDSVDELRELPGIGHNTAAAIIVYWQNKPVLFIETNIRTVYIHHFFESQDAVDDKQILEILAKTIDHEHPREFYWALMDYGTHLKKTYGNKNRQSKHYSKQSKFEGSKRQIRGEVIRVLLQGGLPTQKLKKNIPDNRLESVLTDLENEGIITSQKDVYRLV